MELRELATFKMVARTLSFTQAAALLGYAQSSVTAQIQSLEEDLGVPLFSRLGRRIALTEAGEQLLWYADKLLNLAEEARAVVKNAQTLKGSLTIGAPETVCTYHLPLVLRVFRQRVPDVQITFKPLSYADLHRSIKDGAVDIGFLLEESYQAASLHVEPLTREVILPIAAPDHPLTQQTQVSPEDMEGVSLLLTNRGCGYRNLFERILHSAGVHPTNVLEFESVESIKQCVIAGLGVAVLPKVVVEKALADGAMCALNWTHPISVYTQMVWHKERWLSPAMKVFLEVSREVMV